MIVKINRLKNSVLNVTENIKLQLISEKFITEDYINWMNDKEITFYTEQRFIKHDYNTIKNYIKTMNLSENNILYGIFYDEQLIGSIKVGSINFHHKTAEISYLIGNKDFWGKNIITRSICFVLDICFKKIKLFKVSAGVYNTNIASIRALEKNGFICEGVRKKNFILNDIRVDGLVYGKFSSDN